MVAVANPAPRSDRLIEHHRSFGRGAGAEVATNASLIIRAPVTRAFASLQSDAQGSAESRRIGRSTGRHRNIRAVALFEHVLHPDKEIIALVVGANAYAGVDERVGLPSIRLVSAPTS